MTYPLSLPSLTSSEREALPQVLNLADGHSRPIKEGTIRPLLESAMVESMEEDQGYLEGRLLTLLFKTNAGQTLLAQDRYFLSYSATSAIDLVAKFCARNQYTVGLLHPLFDNIARTLDYLKVPLVPIAEEDILDHVTGPARGDYDVLWLVMPNNPTSWQLGRADFERIVQHCQECDIILVVDFCFRFFSSVLAGYDQYEVLENAQGLRWICIEDTGKTWASQEIKVGISVTSVSLQNEFHGLHDDLLLRVSPFIVALLNRLIADPNVLESTLRLVRSNRESVRSALAKCPVTLASSNRTDWALPLEWVKINDHSPLTGTLLHRTLRRRGVEILPGDQFYWHEPTAGRKYARLALNREDRVVRAAVKLVTEVLREGAA